VTGQPETVRHRRARNGWAQLESRGRSTIGKLEALVERYKGGKGERMRGAGAVSVVDRARRARADGLAGLVRRQRAGRRAQAQPALIPSTND